MVCIFRKISRLNRLLKLVSCPFFVVPEGSGEGAPAAKRMKSEEFLGTRSTTVHSFMHDVTITSYPVCQIQIKTSLKFTAVRVRAVDPLPSHPTSLKFVTAS